ncbi:MAG: hypothetical protein FWC76_02700 [Defluviitaleaceae bacterium]|nr:hypothetical protein [Defluviitaleaceae bacterium]
MGKKIGRWLVPQGLALISGWRRQGEGLADVAGKIGVSAAQLKRWAAEHEEIDAALRIDKEAADFMVEGALFDKALAGDHKAYEFWLRHRMPEKWGKAAKEDEGIRAVADYGRLAELINNPVEREGSCFE